MKFEFPEINKVCFETESIAADGGAGDKPNVTLYDDNNASNAVI